MARRSSCAKFAKKHSSPGRISPNTWNFIMSIPRSSFALSAVNVSFETITWSSICEDIAGKSHLSASSAEKVLKGSFVGRSQFATGLWLFKVFPGQQILQFMRGIIRVRKPICVPSAAGDLAGNSVIETIYYRLLNWEFCVGRIILRYICVPIQERNHINAHIVMQPLHKAMIWRPISDDIPVKGFSVIYVRKAS